MKLVAILVLLTAHGAWCDNCTTEYSCASCTEVRICGNTTSGYTELFRFSCPSSNPYCVDTGTCSPFPTEDCTATDSYPCTQDGTFPNPTDCQKYHECQNGTSLTYTCPAFYNFDSTQGACVRNALCYTISCYSKTGVKVPYHDAGIYAYCLNGNAVFVERCPGSYKLNSDTQKCAPSCQGVGYKIPDVDDCTKYYSCTMEPYASDYTVISEQCPVGYGFDPRYLRCVPLKLLPSCSVQTNFTVVTQN